MWFNHEILADALAIITSQEQRIKELNEENARLEKLCALRDRDCKETQDLLYKAEAKNAELEKKYALAVAEREANVKGFSETLAVIHDDTVRKMQERLEEFFDGENDYQRCSHGRKVGQYVEAQNNLVKRSKNGIDNTRATSKF